MATVYFTSNADSGSGTLRDCVENASDGDVIMPDPNTFSSSGDITIELSSGLPLSSISGVNNISIFGSPAQRIILDKQDNGYFLRVTTSGKTIQFKYVDFTRGRRTSSNESPVYVSSTNTTLVFENCKFYSNVGAYSGFLRGIASATGSSLTFKNCVAYDNSYTNSSYTADFFTFQSGANADISVLGCTLDCQTIPFLNPSSVTKTDSLLGGTSDWNIDFDTVGFVDRTNNDYRLLPTSSYLTGGSLTGTDILGHTRNGSLGAYDGSWFVVPANGTATVSADTTVDYAEIGSGATVNFTNANLTVTKNADIDTSTFASSSTAYLAVPSGTYFNLSTFTNVVHCTYGGEVTAVAGSVDLRTCTFSVTKTGTETVDCIEYKTEEDTSWSKIVNLTDSSTTFSTVTDKGFYLRAYDGVNFVTSSWIPRTYYYKGNATSGSFATSSDWAMDSQKTLTCNAAPSIKEGTFHCE